VPLLGEARLNRLLAAGEVTYLANLRNVAERDATCRRALEAGEALIEQFAGEDDVAPDAIVDLLAERLGCGPVGHDGIDAVRGDIEAAPASEWLQRVVTVSEPTQRESEEMPDAIPVYTIFGAKGLQAPVVFLMNALEQSFTGRGSVEDGVRRAYVAVTRASEHLVISAPLYLRGSTLEHTVGTRAGGLAEIIAGPARHAGIEVEPIRAEDI
jgi:superfamily I DNA/RNA helicase